jgi:predicted TIM-barrel fold metal-dependent hydrolase
LIIDMHASLVPDDPEAIGVMVGRVPTPEACVPAETLRRMDANGVERAVVWKVGYNSEDCRRGNDFISAQRDAHPDRFIAFATVYPHEQDQALAELDRAVGELGMSGVKLHPNVMDIPLDHPGVAAVVRRVAELGLPFVTHVNGTRVRDLPADLPDADDDDPGYRATANARPELLAGLVAAYDSPRFQSAHMGGVALDWLGASTITFQTTGVDVRTIQWAVDNLGPERVVFGSDFPFFTVEDELKKIAELDVSDDDRARLLSGNALERVLRPGTLS